MTLRRTLHLIQTDYRVLKDFYRLPGGFRTLCNLLLYPGFIAVFMYRWSHFFYVRRMRLISRLLFFASITLTCSEINPASIIGEGLLMLHTTGTIVTGKLGNYVRLTAAVRIGGDASGKDIGAGPGLPVVGDRTLMGAQSCILGPCLIGEDAFIMANSFVIKDVPAGASVFGSPAKVLRHVKRNALNTIVEPEA